MNSLYLIPFIILLFSCNGGPPALQSMPYDVYVASIKAARIEKDNAWMSHHQSPISGLTEEFTGIKYFEPNLEWKIRVRIPDKIISHSAILKDTKGGNRKYSGKVKLPFEFRNQVFYLEVFQEAQTGNWFVPFKDVTSGKETYAGGRYVEIKGVPGDSAWLDFNYAYHPYCYYDERYSCPVVPKSNYINTVVNAGEKRYFLDH